MLVFGGPGPPIPFQHGVSSKSVISSILLILTLFHLPHAQAEKNKYYSMQSLCKNHFLQQVYRKIDGALLWSQNERNLDCVITFQTHSILQRFMMRFDFLQLDCNDHLYVYDGAHAVGTPKYDISCRNTMQTLGPMFTMTNYVTLKYITDSWGTETNGFKLVISAIKDPKHVCSEFQCSLQRLCIANDLVCDTINHCADGSDEVAGTLCQNNDSGTILGMEKTWFVVLIVITLLILLVFIVAVSICLCKKGIRDISSNAQQQNYSMQQMYGSNGAMMKQNNHHGSQASITQLTQVMGQGNWCHPVGPLGFHLSTPVRARLFCQAK